MKKSQLSIFIIIGLILVILIGFFIFTASRKNNMFFKTDSQKKLAELSLKSNIENIIYSCVEYSAKESLSETGMREETLETYEQIVALRTKSCTSDLISQLKEQNYNIYEEEISVKGEINSETMLVNIIYPLKIEKDSQKVEFNQFTYVFERSNFLIIPGGITDKEIRIVAPNGKAELRLPEGVKITDESGQIVEKIGIKVLDLHFDGLENGVVVGNLIYETFPDKTFFSEPIELTIEFDEKDIPEGYTINNLMIAYWNREDGIWYAQQTDIKNNLATTKITHFSEWSITTLDVILIGNVLFEKRFEPSSGSTESKGKGVWFVGEEDEDLKKGIMILQKDYYKSAYKDWESLQYENDENKEEYLRLYEVFSKDLEGIDAVIDYYKDIGLYKDFTEERNKFKEIDGFISFNKVNYGYFLNPDNPKDKDFIDCEEYDKRNIEEIYYCLGEDGYPYITLQNLNCKKGYTCSEYSNIECRGNNNCEKVGDNICKPVENTFNETEKTVLCVLENQDTLPNSCSDPKIFGWHNFQCVGGKVRPAEGEEAADFIIFKPKGNAVIAMFGLDKLLINAYSYPNEKTIRLDVLESEKRQLTYPYYCEIQKKPNDLLQLTPTFKFNPSDEIKKKLNLDDGFLGINKNYFAQGIYGVNVIKKTTNHEEVRSDLNAKCEVFWLIVGEGIAYYNNPDHDDFRQLEKGINLDTEKGVLAEVVGAQVLQEGLGPEGYNIIKKILNN